MHGKKWNPSNSCGRDPVDWFQRTERKCGLLSSGEKRPNSGCLRSRRCEVVVAKRISQVEKWCRRLKEATVRESREGRSVVMVGSGCGGRLR
jgi:hypothetical protein